MAKSIKIVWIILDIITELWYSVNMIKMTGHDVVKHIKSIGTDGGLSEFESDRITKMTFTVCTINIDTLRENDRNFKDYVESGDLREFDSDNLSVEPVISESNQVIDGYNRLLQQYKNGVRRIRVFKELEVL